MKKTSLLTALLAVCLVLTATLGTAWAYFTSYTEASGGYKLELNDKYTPPPEIEERFAAWVKTVRIKNADDGEPVFVRVRAFGPEAYPLTYTDELHNWTLGSDGWYYCNDVLMPGARTAELKVKINDVPEKAVIGTDFDVVVVYESVKAQFNTDGTAYADWGVSGR